MFTCPRCQREIASQGAMNKHRPVCDKLPTPAELTAEFRASLISSKALAKKYGMDCRQIAWHLKTGGITKAEAAKRRKELRCYSAPKHEPPPAMTPLDWRDAPGELCIRCYVLLSHPEVPKGKHGLCGWCLGEVPNVYTERFGVDSVDYGRHGVFVRFVPEGMY